MSVLAEQNRLEGEGEMHKVRKQETASTELVLS